MTHLWNRIKKIKTSKYKDYVLSPEICIFRKLMEWKIYVKNNYTTQYNYNYRSRQSLTFLILIHVLHTYQFPNIFSCRNRNAKSRNTQNRIVVLHVVVLVWFDVGNHDWWYKSTHDISMLAYAYINYGI